MTTLSNLLRMLYSRVGTYLAKQAHLEAEAFSPNTPHGACPECHGLGRVYTATERSMVPDPSKTIRERAIAAWPPAWQGQNLREYMVSADCPLCHGKRLKRESLSVTFAALDISEISRLTLDRHGASGAGRAA